MNYNTFCGERISHLGMGGMRFPTLPQENAPIDVVKAQQIIDYAMSNGINYYDTAYIYHNGTSEVFMGQALKKYPRDSYYIADKFNYMANPDYKAQFSEQLNRLQLDRIDFYLLHSVTDSLYEKLTTCGCIEYFEQKLAEGIINHFGFSFHGSAQCLRNMLALRKWDFVQIQLNYYDWLYGDSKELYEILEEANIPIIVMEPVRGGRLADLTPETNAILKNSQPDHSIASWAMRWVMRLPQIKVVLSGMSAIEQVTDNVATYSGTALDDASAELLESVCQKFKSALTVPCTGCRYCCPDCPIGIEIPSVLATYNRMKLAGTWVLGEIDKLPEGKRPEDCVGCGSCKSHCPQDIDIPALMAEITQLRGK